MKPRTGGRMKRRKLADKQRRAQDQVRRRMATMMRSMSPQGREEYKARQLETNEKRRADRHAARKAKS